MLKVLRIDHIALAVPEIAPAFALWQSLLGLGAGPQEHVAGLSVDAAFLMTPAQGEACLELVAPNPPEKNPGLTKFLARRGGLHHIAFAVADVQSALDELAERGVPLIDRQARPGARGHQVAFLHPRAMGGVLVELVSG